MTATLTTLEQLTRSGRTLDRHYELREYHQSHVDANQSSIDTLEQRDLPDMMNQLDLTELKLQSGRRITLTDFINTSIKDEAVCFAWLKEQGSDGIIKNEIKIAMPRGDNEAAQALSTKLHEEGIPHTLKPTIHHATLKSTVKEILNGELRDLLPREAFGVSEFQKVVFK
jgi:hypothetical protein